MGTLVRVGLENSPFDERWMAWVLDYPGCFAYGKDDGEALMNVPRALIEYQVWVNRHTPQSWLQDLRDFDVRLVETWKVISIQELYPGAAGDHTIEAYFRNDWKPLDDTDLQRCAQLLSWQREDLLMTVRELSDAKLDQTYPGQRWSIRGILKHIGGAEWWYQERLGLTHEDEAEIPEDAFERLTFARDSLMTVLPDLVGAERVVGRDGEFWSPRKMLRRALWHERDHIQHIHQLL